MNYVKEGYKKIQKKLDNIVELYSYIETRNILLKNDYYLKFCGRTKHRTLIKENPKLYKSINKHSEGLEFAMRNQGSVTGFGWSHRIKFIAELDSNLELLRCQCGKKYNWTKFCRYCPEPKRTWKGKKHTLETKLKMRESTLKYIHDRNGQVSPRYNKSSIPILEQKAEELGIDDLQHAENGGEFQVLGYFVDGYSKERNVVIEYDEEYHFNKDGKLKERDIHRQKEIEEYLDCEFIRISNE